MNDFAENQDVIASTEVAQAMGMHPWEIASNPERNAKFSEISEYFGPFEDKTFLIRKLTKGMMKDEAIDHVFKYVHLRKDFSKTKEKFDALNKELERYEQ